MKSPIVRDVATVPRAYHVLAAAFVGCCTWLALRRADLYSAAMQEDRAVEWATVWFFAAAGTLLLMRAVRERRLFDVLVGLFCLFVAGEEMSWGQRLFGMTPPAYFLEHNRQQEINVHNFGVLFSSPKWPLMLVILGYAVVLPVVAMAERGRRLLARVGATPPPAPTIPWFLAAVVLLYWYPFRFTGEWVELLVGSAFFVAAGVPTAALFASSGGIAAAALVLAAWSSRGGTTKPGQLACATAEVRALADGLAKGAAKPDLLQSRSVHKRLWTMSKEDYIDFGVIGERLNDVRCADEAEARGRRRYAVDPWGTAYWVRTSRDAGSTMATVYSFGPNRRRDVDADAVYTGDDIVARTTIGSK